MDEVLSAICCLDRIDVDTLWYGAGSLRQISEDLASAIEDAVTEIKKAKQHLENAAVE
jgi:hypothetical protein